MDTDTVDRQFAALQAGAQQTATLVQALASKLMSASASGDPNAREWALDLREIALSIRDEQNTTTGLLQAIHALVDDHVTAAPAPAPAYDPPYQPPQYQQAAAYQQPAPYQQPQQYQQPAGGGLQRFLGGRFGQAMVAGAGIGVGEDLVNSIFDRF